MRARYVGAFVIGAGIVVGALVALLSQDAPAAVSSVAGIPPGSDPLWLAPPPRFAGQIVHGTVANWMHSPAADGGAIDKRETGEFWIELDSNGSVLRSHEVFRANDGAVTQEGLYHDGVETVMYGSDVPGAPPACREMFANPTPRVVPPFAVDAATLKSLGFTPVQPGNWDRPDTPPLAGVSPVETYQWPGDAQAWGQRIVLDGDGVHNAHFEIAASGRFVVMKSWDEDAAGKVSSVMQQVYGNLDVYSAKSVPESVFEPVLHDERACHE